jgi:hypothetical protein
MPIKVQCACGAAFAAKDELAGRTVKCPKCQQPLKIPGAAAAPQAVAAGTVAARAPAPAQKVDDHWDDVGLGARAAGTHPCPGCAAPLQPNAILCVKCGYNLKLGRRLETVKIGVGGAASGDGHGSAAQELLARAAQSIKEDEEAEKAKTKEGMPWWVYLIGLICVVGFLVMMSFIPQGTAMIVAGGLIWGIASLIGFYTTIRIIIIAFNEGIACGLL